MRLSRLLTVAAVATIIAFFVVGPGWGLGIAATWLSLAALITTLRNL